MTDIQKRIFLLLCEIDDICKKHSIPYFFEGGSALGAIRHGGFLPWDDDADLAMTRENWEKFRKAFEDEKPPNRMLESPEINSDYPTVAMRYVDTSSTRLWRSLMYDICSCGVAVDIFILEPAPDDPSLLEKMKQDLIDYCELTNRYYRISSLGDTRRYSRHWRAGRLLGHKRVAKRLNQRIMKYNEADCNRYLMRWAFSYQVYPKQMFGTPQYVPFEGRLFPVPEQIYEYLDYQYGTDWYIIPQDDAIDLHDTVLDLDTAYQAYVDDYMPFINKKRAIALNSRYKNHEMRALNDNNAYHRNMYGIAGIAEAYVVERRMQQYSREDLSVLLSGDITEGADLFDKLFAGYLQKQLYRWYLFFNVFIPVSDETLFWVFVYLLRCSRIRDVEKILNLRINQEKPLSAGVEKLYGYLTQLKQCLTLFWAENWEQLRPLLTGLSKEFDLAPIQQVIELFCDYHLLNQNADKRKEFLALKQRTFGLLIQHPAENLLKLLYADILLQLKDEQNAATLYFDLLNNSKNGMILNKIQTNPTIHTVLSKYRPDVCRIGKG